MTSINSFNFAQLVRFLTLAEELHFTRAAERLGIAQPLLSAQIHSLEDAVGVRLFRRTSRRVELTSAGKIFRDRVQLIVQGMRDTVEATQAAKREAALRLRIGYTDEFATELLPDCIRDLKARWPSSNITLVLGLADDLVEMLKASVLDVALACPIPESLAGSDFKVLTLPVMPLAVALPVGHRLAGRDVVSLAELESEPFIEGPEEPVSASERVVSRLFAYAGLKRTIVQRMSDIELGLNLVARGVGVYVASYSPQVRARTDISIVDLDAEGADITRAVIWRDRSSPKILEQLIANIHRAFPEDAAPPERPRSPRRRSGQRTGSGGADRDGPASLDGLRASG